MNAHRVWNKTVCDTHALLPLLIEELAPSVFSSMVKSSYRKPCQGPGCLHTFSDVSGEITPLVAWHLHPQIYWKTARPTFASELGTLLLAGGETRTNPNVMQTNP